MLRALFVGLLFLCTLSFASAQTIAHVNFGNLLNDLPTTETADKELEAFSQRLTKQGEAMVAKLREDYAAAEAQVQNLPPVELQKLQAKLQKDQQAILKFEQDMTKQIEAKRGELLGPIIEQAKAAVARVAKAGDYGIVLDSSIFNAVLFAEEATDLTPAVRKEMGM